MKKGFTITEVSILFIIFVIVALLVAPLSMDDTIQAKNTSRWKNVQQEFSNIFYTIEASSDNTSLPFTASFETILDNEIKSSVEPYKIKYLNGSNPEEKYLFNNYKLTYSNAIVAFKFYNEPDDGIKGIIMYDVNGKNNPNIWGKDVFGLNIYEDRLEPIGKTKSLNKQKLDCSKNGTGVLCSNYYLIGGNFD